MKGLKVGVIGAGRSGLAAVRLLRRLGAQVFLSERGKIQGKLPPQVAFESGKHSTRLLQSHLIVRSPGVPSHLPILQRAAQSRVPLWSELELAYRHLACRQLLAITGTNGKTTTTTLVGEFFKAAGQRTWVGGNIGTPLSDLVQKSKPRDTVVAEVSSYQLENIHAFRPQISAILNITPDHLEHHGTMRAYARAKGKIFENQSAREVCVLNADDPWCRRLARSCQARLFWFSRTKTLRSGVFWSKRDLVIRWGGRRARWRLQTLLPGPHNIENILASVAMATAGGVSQNILRQVLTSFPGVEHRLEWVRTFNGVRYVNDSKATNVDSTRVALDSFEQPLVLIMGGQGKGSPYAPLKRPVQKKVRHLLLIGEDARRIARELGGVVPVEHVRTMPRAVQRAGQLAREGDVVLLSPACASFDQYQNYEERGRDFKTLVLQLR